MIFLPVEKTRNNFTIFCFDIHCLTIKFIRQLFGSIVNLLHYVKVEKYQTGDSTKQKRNDNVTIHMHLVHNLLEQYGRQHNKAGIVKFSVGVFFLQHTIIVL